MTKPSTATPCAHTHRAGCAHTHRAGCAHTHNELEPQELDKPSARAREGDDASPWFVEREQVDRQRQAAIDDAEPRRVVDDSYGLFTAPNGRDYVTDPDRIRNRP